MSFFARYTFPDDTSVDGDAIASNSGTLAWSNAALARATPGTALAHLAAHGWDDRWDDLEHEFGELLHAVPDANVAAITAAVLAAVRARPEGAAALLVTDGEPADEEGDEFEEGITESEYQLLSEADRSGLTLKTITDRNGRQVKRWVRTDTAAGADRRARSGGHEDVIDRAFREPKSLTKQQVKELADHIAALPKERLRQLALAAKQRIGPTKAAIADRLLAHVRSSRKAIDKAKKPNAPKKAATVATPEDRRAEFLNAEPKPGESPQEFAHRHYPELKALKNLTVEGASTRMARGSIHDLYMMGPLAEALDREGVSVYISDKPLPQTDDMGHMAGQSPRNWPAGLTWDVVAGGFEAAGKKTIAGTGQGGSWSLLAHEHGHAIGYVFNLDYDPAAHEFHKRLFERLSDYEKQGGPGGFAGSQEMIAESIAIMVRRGKADVAETYSPDYAEWLESKLNAHGGLRRATGQAAV